jgi:hypothetical protein
MRRKHVLANDGEVVGVSYCDEKRIWRELPSCMDDATINRHIEHLKQLKYLASGVDFKYFAENPESNAYLRRVEPYEAINSRVNAEEHLVIVRRLRANEEIVLASLADEPSFCAPPHGSSLDEKASPIINN